MAGPVGRVRGVGECILLAIVTFGIYTFVWTYRTHKEIRDYDGRGVGGLLGLLIWVFAEIVTFFLMPYEVGRMIERAGERSRVSGLTGFWLLLPLAGPLVWFVKVQGQLNEFWAVAAYTETAVAA